MNGCFFQQVLRQDLGWFVKILNDFNNLTLKQTFWKRKTLFKKPDYLVLIESTKIENAPYKTAISEVNVNSIQDGGREKDPPTSFSLVTSTNVGISPQNLLTFSFNPFATLI